MVYKEGLWSFIFNWNNWNNWNAMLPFTSPSKAQR